MTALSASSALVRKIQDSDYSVHPVGASQTLYMGALVCLDPDTGDAIEATGSLQGHLRVVGVACGELAKGTTSPVLDNDAIASAAGDVNVLLGQGKYTFVNDTGDSALSAADVGVYCYAKDDQTVSLNSDVGNRPIAGRFCGLHDDGRCIVEVGNQGAFSGEVVLMIANASLASLQYSQVKLADDTGDAEVAGATDPADHVLGILLNTPTAGQIAKVAISGFAPCVVGAAGVTAGGNFAATTAGAQITSAAAKSVTGRSLETGTSGQTKMVVIARGQVAA
jgi:hypothetical protein